MIDVYTAAAQAGSPVLSPGMDVVASWTSRGRQSVWVGLYAWLRTAGYTGQVRPRTYAGRELVDELRSMESAYLRPGIAARRRAGDRQAATLAADLRAAVNWSDLGMGPRTKWVPTDKPKSRPHEILGFGLFVVPDIDPRPRRSLADVLAEP